MAAIISGTGLGLFTNLLGAGSASVGRGGQSDRVYLNGATGNLVVQTQDDYLASIGVDLSLIRTYNSQGQFTDDNGDNWQLGLHRRIHGLTGTVNTAGSTVRKVFGDGADVLYTYDTASGVYISTAGDGAHDTVSFNESTQQWTWTDGSTRQGEVYNATGQLISTRDSDGNATTFTYTATANGSLLTQITDASGQVTHFDYTGTNLTQIRTVSNGQTQTKVRYTYDTQNRLSQVIVDLTPDDNSIADNNTYTTTYAYDGTSKRIASITHGDGSSIAFTYELVNGQYRVATYTDGEGRVTTLNYSSVAGGLQTDVTTPTNQLTTYYTDAEGRVTRLLAPAVNGIRAETLYTYDASGNVTSVTDARGNVTVMEYDSRGNVVLSRDALGNTVTRTYSATNQLLSETVYTVADPDGAGSAQPSGALTTHYVYDSEDHLRFSVSADGRVTEHRYAANGNRTSTHHYATNRYAGSSFVEADLAVWGTGQNATAIERIDYTYDFRGNVSTVTSYGETDSSGAGLAASASVTRFIYDQRGQLLQTIDARGEGTVDPNDYVTTYTYDGLGRVLTTSQWVSAGVTHTSLNSYDDANRRTTVTLQNGLATTSTYDRAGWLLSVAQSDTSGALGTTTYKYDAAGQLRVLIDPTGVGTHFLYDEAGRKIAAIDGTGALTETIYDAAGNAIRAVTYANRVTSGNLASLTDSNGNPTSVALAAIRPTANAAADRVVRNIYDNANRLTLSITTTDTDANQGYVTQSFYDGAGRLTDVIRYNNPISLVGLPATPSVADITTRITTNAADRHTRSFYDNDGKLIGTLDAEGYLTETKYDAAGRATQTIAYANQTSAGLRASGTFEQLKTNAGTDVNDQRTYVFYNGQGQVIASLNAEGYLAEYAYDAAGNQTEEIRYYSQGASYTGTQTIAQLRPTAHANDCVKLATYDGSGKVTSETERYTNPSTGVVTSTTTTYQYDAVGNVIATTKAAGTTEARTARARYDAKGQVLQTLTAEGSSALETLLTQNPSATQAQIDAIWSQWGLTHTYDQAGRRTSTTDQNGHATLFYYDSASRLTHTVNALGEVTEVIYNSFGQTAQTIRYAARIATTGLTGGLVTQTLTDRLTAIGSAADSRTETNYTLRGAVQSAIDELSNQTVFTYTAFGELATRTDPISGTSSLLSTHSYDKRGLKTQSITDPSGINAVVFVQYDAFGRVFQTTDANGNQRAHRYDKLGREVLTGDPSGTRYASYDAFGRVLEQIDRLGNATRYSYNDADRSVTVTTPEGIQAITVKNRHGETVTITDGRENSTTYTYDKNGNLTATTDPAGTRSAQYDGASRVTQTTDANGNVTTYTYDAANRVLTRTVDPTGLNLTTSYTYDAKGQTATMTDAEGTVTQTTYDNKGQVTAVAVDPSGLNLRTTYTYDARGKTLTVTEGAGTATTRVTQYTYDALGRRTREQVDPAGLNITTEYAYDDNNNLIAKTDANGHVTRYFYDGNDRQIYTLDALNGLAQTDYDAEGRVIKTTRYANALQNVPTNPTNSDISSRIVTSSADQAARYVYDRDGRKIYTVDGLWAVTKHVYDANGNVIEQIAYVTAIPSTTALTVAGITAALQPGNNDQNARTVYDAANRAIYTIDAAGYVTQNHYDANGNVIRTVAYATAITVSGNPTAGEVAALVTANPTLDRSLRTVYDRANRAVYTIDAAGYVKETQYDDVGRVTRTIDHGQPIYVGDTPTIQQVQTAFSPDAVSVTTTNSPSTYYLDPVQPYAYLQTAQQDTPVTASQNIDGSITSSAIVDQQPIQPYVYVASAKQDAATVATQSVTLSVTNQSLAQSASVNNYAWTRSGSTLVQTSGLSLAIGTAPRNDNTPTTVRATIYRSDGSHYASVHMDVGYWVAEDWYAYYYDESGTVHHYSRSSSEPVYATDESGNTYQSGTRYGVRTSDGYRFEGVSNWNGQVNLASGMPAGQYTVVIETLDQASANGSPGTYYDYVDGTWSQSATVNVVIGTIVQPTIVSWGSSTQPAGTTVNFRYRPSGSSSEYTTASVGVSGSNHQVNLGGIAAGNYEYQIEYTDAYGRIVKHASGGFASNVAATTNTTANFNYTQVTSTTVAGSSISGYIPLSDVASIEYVDAVVTDRVTGAIVSTARTYPEFEANYNGEINLSVGQALPDGSYTVAITVRRKNGTIENRPTFTYELGLQSFTRNTLSWPSSVVPPGTAVSFEYRAAGSGGAYNPASVDTVGASQRVVFDRLIAGNYEYNIEYSDSYGRIIKWASGTFAASDAPGTNNNTSILFSYSDVVSTQVAGSSISGYVAATDVPTIDRVRAVVTDASGNIVSTAWTYPEFELNYNGNVNLAVNAPLADGRYSIAITYFNKDGTTTSRPVFLYEVGLQSDHLPMQPYAYIASATQDAASQATLNATLQAANSSQVQSPSVANYAWYRTGGTIHTGTGMSIRPGYINFGDSTPTQVRATISKDGAHYATTYTDVAYTEQEYWENTESGPQQTDGSYGYPVTRWRGVTNWNGEVNLATWDLPPGTYSVVLEVRDDVIADVVYSEYGATEYDGDGTWVYSSTLTINVGVISNTTQVSWPASTQPTGTTVSFSYRASGSGAQYLPVAVTQSGSNLQAPVGNIPDGTYDYIITYTDGYGRVVSSASGTFVNAGGQTTSTNAPFVYTQLTSTATTGSSIGGYISASDASSIDYIIATVRNRLTGSTISTATTYPGAHSTYNGEVNLSVGAALTDGSYSVSIAIHRKDGTVENRPAFRYEIGVQNNVNQLTRVSWSAANQPENSYAVFSYAPLGSSNYTQVPITQAGGQNQVTFTNHVGGVYRYYVRYYENTTNQLLKEATGQFTVAAGTSSATTTLEFQADLSTAPVNRENVFAYDNAGRLIDSTDAEGFSEHYEYDALGNKISFINKNGSEWTYEYDAAGRQIVEHSPVVAVTTVAANLAVTTENVSLQTHMTYDAVGNVTSRTEGYGRTDARTLQYQYDALGRQIRTIFPQVGVYNSAADNLSTTGTSGVVSRTEMSTTPESRVYYDTLGNAIVGRDALGNYSYKVYDGLNRVKYEIDAEHYVTEHAYDRFGNRTHVTRYTNRIDISAHSDPTAGFSAAEVASLIGGAATSRTIETRYNRLNQIEQIIQPETFVYDSSATGDDRYFTAAGTTRNVYNAFGELILQSILRNPRTNSWDDTYHYYDRRGNEVAQVDSFGYLTTRTFDGQGNLTRQVEYARALQQSTWSTTTYGAPVSTTPQHQPNSAIGYDRETRYSYDRKNQKIAETRVNVEYANPTGNLAVQTVYGDLTTTLAYDAVGNLVRTTDASGASTYAYFDALGRSVAAALPADGGAFSLLTTDYDAFGATSREVRHANGTASASIDGYAAPTSNANDQVSLKLYDAHGHVIQAVDAEGKSNYFSYTALGKVAKEWQPITDIDGKIQNAIKVYQYNNLGQQIATIEPSYLPDTRPSQVAAPVSMDTSYLNWTILQNGTDGAEDGYYGNQINLSWTAMAGWGGGDVMVEIFYRTADRTYTDEGGITQTTYGNDTQITRTFSSAVANGGVTIEWMNGDTDGAGGIGQIYSIRVQKQRADGSWQQIHHRTSSGAYANLFSFSLPPQTGAQINAVRYRPVSGGSWVDAPFHAFGARYVFDGAGIPAGNYYFEVLYTFPGDSTPSRHAAGQFTINGAQGTITNAEPNVSYVASPLNPSQVPVEPSYLSDMRPAQVAAPVSMDTSYLNWTILQNGTDGAEDGYYGNQMNLGWTPMNAWGSGDVMVEIYYRTSAGVDTHVIRTFASAIANEGVTIEWMQGDTDAAGGIELIHSVRVQKRQADGSWLQIHHRSTSGEYAKFFTFTLPPETGVQVNAVRYRPVSGGAWANLPFYSFGTRHMFVGGGIPAGNYYFEVIYALVGETTPSRHATGVFAINGAQGTISNFETYVSSIPSPQNASTFITSQVEYNAFGEIVRKGVNGWQEYYEYDAAGHLWRTNSQGGVDKVYLYDLKDQVTSEIASQQLDLRNGYADAQSIAALNANVMRTDTVYGYDENTVKQVQPAFEVNQSLEVNNTPIAYPTAELHFSILQTGGGGESGYNQSQVNLSWNAMAAWGNGDVRVDLEYRTAITNVYDESGAQHTSGGDRANVSRTFTSSTANTGVTLVWDDTPSAPGNQGISEIIGVRVYKRDMSGGWALIHSRSTNGVYGNHMLLQTPAELGGRVAVQVTRVSDGAISLLPAHNLGSKTFADLSGLPHGNYTYTVFYYHKDPNSDGTEPTPYARSDGQFTINGTPGTLTPVVSPTSTAIVTPVIEQTLDRWGNILTITNPRNALAKTTYRYNYENKALSEAKPEVDVWGINGFSTRSSPTTYSYYDKLGRQIQTVDANGFATGLRYDAANRLVAEYRPDGGVVSYTYDRLGRKTSQTDANDEVITYQYDRMDRVIREQFPIGANTFAYDEVGNRILHTNANGETYRYWYDTRGKMIRSRLPMGQETNTTYDARGNEVREVNANGDIVTSVYDYFGRLLSRVDLGGHVHAYSYNRFGGMTREVSTRGQNIEFAYYANGALKTITDHGVGAETYYQYDAAGNRVGERFTKGGVVHQDNRIQYDDLGRMVAVQDNRYSLSYGYDANGNRRFAISNFHNTEGEPRRIENWYLYDSMNRITLSQGVRVNGGIHVTTGQGVELGYDAVGNRRTAFYYSKDGQNRAINERYDYDANHRLTHTYINNVFDSSRTYDALGRVIEQISGATTSYERRVNQYNQNGQLVQQDMSNASGELQNRVLYTRYDNLGNVLNYEMTVYPNFQYTNYYSYAYAKFDSYRERVMSGTSTYFQPGNTTTEYDINGNILSVNDQHNTSKYRTYVVDQSGFILNATEAGVTQYYFYVNGNPHGSTGAKDNADFDFNYQPVSDRYPSTSPGSYVVSQRDVSTPAMALKTIAAAVFGDSSLWYLIADANGVKADGSDLRVGQVLIIPNRISNIHANANTFKLYGPWEIIGSTVPTLPQPPPPPQSSGKRRNRLRRALNSIDRILIKTSFGIPPSEKDFKRAAADVKEVFSDFDFRAWYKAQWKKSYWPSPRNFEQELHTQPGMPAVEEAFAENPWLATVVAVVLNFFIPGAGLLFMAGFSAYMTSISTGSSTKGFKAGAKAYVLSSVTQGVSDWAGGAISSMTGSTLAGTVGGAMAGNLASQGVGVAAGWQEEVNWRGVAAAGVGAAATYGIYAAMNGGRMSGGMETFKDGSQRFVGDGLSRTIGGIGQQLVFNKGKVDWTSVAVDAFGNMLGSFKSSQERKVRNPISEFIAGLPRPGSDAHLAVSKPLDFGDLVNTGGGTLTPSGAGGSSASQSGVPYYLARDPSQRSDTRTQNRPVDPAKQLLEETNKAVDALAKIRDSNIPREAKNIQAEAVISGALRGVGDFMRSDPSAENGALVTNLHKALNIYANEYGLDPRPAMEPSSSNSREWSDPNRPRRYDPTGKGAIYGGWYNDIAPQTGAVQVGAQVDGGGFGVGGSVLNVHFTVDDKGRAAFSWAPEGGGSTGVSGKFKVFAAASLSWVASSTASTEDLSGGWYEQGVVSAGHIVTGGVIRGQTLSSPSHSFHGGQISLTTPGNPLSGAGVVGFGFTHDPIELGSFGRALFDFLNPPSLTFVPGKPPLK